MSLFTDANIKEEIQTSYMPDKPRRSARAEHKAKMRKALRKENAAEIIKLIGGWPEPGYSVDVISNGQSNAGGFFEVFLDEFGVIDELCIATWIINRDYINKLSDYSETGKIKKLYFLLSSRMAHLGNQKANFNLLKQRFTDISNISFRVAKTHAKTYSMKSGDKYIIIDGSGNWSHNPRIENYTITNCKAKHEFRKMWMKEIIER